MAKILLVEDDKSLREIYGVRLMAEGYEIVSAGDGEEALAMAIKERPSLIVSDVMMPKISGFDMLDILRSTSETKDVKVIMMTALSSDDQRARGEALGADRYLVKSQVGIEDVVRTVHDVLGDGLPGATPTPAAIPVPTPTPTAAPITASAQVPSPTVAPVNPAPATPTPTPQPAQPAPVVTPVAPAPVVEPAVPVQPIPQLVAPIVNIPTPITPPAPVPVAPVAAALPPTPAAVPSPVPAPNPQPVAPQSTVISELPPNPTPVATPNTLPQPTAPFSTPAPASLGERVIEPLTNPATAGPADFASQLQQELSGTTNPTTQPPVPPVA